MCLWANCFTSLAIYDPYLAGRGFHTLLLELNRVSYEWKPEEGADSAVRQDLGGEMVLDALV